MIPPKPAGTDSSAHIEAGAKLSQIALCPNITAWVSVSAVSSTGRSTDDRRIAIGRHVTALVKEIQRISADQRRALVSIDPPIGLYDTALLQGRRCAPHGDQLPIIT
jgi:hypothetical protein